MKKIVAILLTLIMSLSVFTACTTLKDGDKGAIISVYLAAEPYSFDPAKMPLDADSVQFFGLIYESLTTINSKGEVKSGLAKDWYGKYIERDDEYRMYFELRETKWDDGRAVSADDVVYAWKRILSPNFESPYASLLYPIKNAMEVKAGTMSSDSLGIAAADSTLLEITFQSEYDVSLFAATVASPALAPLREDMITRDEANWARSSSTIVANGPFRVQNYEAYKKVVLERNVYYRRDEEDDALDKYVLPYRLVCTFAEDSKAYTLDELAELFENESIFYLGNFNKTTYDKYSSKIKSNDLLSSYVYYFNTQNELLSDARVRQALSMALDRNYIVNNIAIGQKAATGFVPDGVYNTKGGTSFRENGTAIYSTSADVEGAKKLLADAGVSGGSFTLSYYQNNNDETSKLIAEYAASVWKEQLGFNVTLKGLTNVNMLKALSTSEENASTTFDVIGLDYSMFSADALAYLAPFATRCSGSYVSIDFEKDAFTPHVTGLADEAYDKLVEEAIYIKSLADRAAKIHEIEAKFAELCPATALYFNVSNSVSSSKLEDGKKEFFGYNNFDRLALEGYKDINSKEAAAASDAAAQS